MYFESCTSVEEIKKLYRKLAMQHHPDRGGDLETMQEINAEYQAALKRADGSSSVGDHGKTYTYHYESKREQELMNVIHKLIALNMDGVEIYLIGLWIWVTGETKLHRAALKDLGLKWNPKRASWFYKGCNTKGWSRGSLSDIADKYGCEAVNLRNQSLSV